MSEWTSILSAVAIVPIVRAWAANRRTPLRSALGWGTAAWLAWTWAGTETSPWPAYLALSLTACAGVSVLGSRRPGAVAWNAVVGSLGAVLVTPFLQDFLTGTSWLESPIWLTFLGIVILVGVGNYLGTGLGLGAAALGAACVIQMVGLSKSQARLSEPATILAMASPWLAWAPSLLARPTLGIDRLWRQFRDRYGAVWGLRVREQFNAAARNSAVSIELGWTGVGPASAEQQAAGLALLESLVQRFGLP